MRLLLTIVFPILFILILVLKFSLLPIFFKGLWLCLGEWKQLLLFYLVPSSTNVKWLWFLIVLIFSVKLEADLFSLPMIANKSDYASLLCWDKKEPY